ncbi:hypothetical protein NDU88_003902 [Pleurodeles waltl]|uniref:Uncharacterized protein n=1 Tax=Pleurodeles waltl TaxID=8319 RepID=A0AAV7W3G3_PLEWA|nr:hypothetical protein NDU88_003902 [Pleurodeles waltl]
MFPWPRRKLPGPRGLHNTPCTHTALSCGLAFTEGRSSFRTDDGTSKYSVLPFPGRKRGEHLSAVYPRFIVIPGQHFTDSLQYYSNGAVTQLVTFLALVHSVSANDPYSLS